MKSLLKRLKSIGMACEKLYRNTFMLTNYVMSQNILTICLFMAYFAWSDMKLCNSLSLTVNNSLQLNPLVGLKE